MEGKNLLIALIREHRTGWFENCHAKTEAEPIAVLTLDKWVEEWLW
jgi:hypothetical protein